MIKKSLDKLFSAIKPKKSKKKGKKKKLTKTMHLLQIIDKNIDNLRKYPIVVERDNLPPTRIERRQSISSGYPSPISSRSGRTEVAPTTPRYAEGESITKKPEEEDEGEYQSSIADPSTIQRLKDEFMNPAASFDNKKTSEQLTPLIKAQFDGYLKTFNDNPASVGADKLEKQIKAFVTAVNERPNVSKDNFNVVFINYLKDQTFPGGKNKSYQKLVNKALDAHIFEIKPYNKKSKEEQKEVPKTKDEPIIAEIVKSKKKKKDDPDETLIGDAAFKELPNYYQSYITKNLPKGLHKQIDDFLINSSISEKLLKDSIQNFITEFKFDNKNQKQALRSNLLKYVSGIDESTNAKFLNLDGNPLDHIPERKKLVRKIIKKTIKP